MWCRVRKVTTHIATSSLVAGSATTEKVLLASKNGFGRYTGTVFLARPSFESGSLTWSGYVLANSSHRRWLANNVLQATRMKPRAPERER